MEIIITHRNPDFDALACQIAASKLYSGAVKVVAGGIPPIVRRFLTLHLDFFELFPVKEVDFDSVTKVIIVDVRSRSRLKDYEPLLKRFDNPNDSLEVHVFDHHTAAGDDVEGTEVQVEPVGSATTLLVEKLEEQDLPITPVEATAMALGIYADTGSLTFDTTTERDSKAAAYLVSMGANMVVLRYFLHAPLSGKQRDVLIQVLSNTTVVELNGLRIGISHVELSKSMTGLSEIVNESLMLSGDEGVFVFFRKGTTVNVIGRAWHPMVDVGKILAGLGGGGHHGAGSATMKRTDLKKAKIRLLVALGAEPPRSVSVRDVMSTEVHTLTPDEILDDVKEKFEEMEISGAPVLKNGKLAGVLSKRDIRVAVRDNRSHMTVASCLSTDVHTTSPDTPLIRVFEKMAEAGVGRLPVIEEENLVGIITRNDLVEALYSRYQSL